MIQNDKPRVIVKNKNLQFIFDYCLESKTPFTANPRLSGDEWEIEFKISDIMGAVALANSDRVVLTSDNPRSENAEDIIKEIQVGLDPALCSVVTIEPDRVQAIEFAIGNADPQDVVLLAGKGHENTQTIGQQVIQHSDAECAQAMLAKRGAPCLR